MSYDSFQPPRHQAGTTRQRDPRSDATLAPARTGEGGGSLRYQAIRNPYHRFDGEYEMPDGEIIQWDDEPQSAHRADR